MSSCGWASDIYMPRHPWYYTCVLLSLSLVVSYRRTKYIASDATPTTPHRLPFPSDMCVNLALFTATALLAISFRIAVMLSIERLRAYGET